MVRLKRLFDSTMSATWCRLQPSSRSPLPRPQQQTIANAIKSYSKVQKLVKHFANSLPVRRTGAASPLLTPLLSSLPGYHQLARLYYFTFFFLPFLALLLFEEAKCFITYSSSHSSRCAKVFINWAAETAA